MDKKENLLETTVDNLRYVPEAKGQFPLGELSAQELRVLATINQKIAAAPSLKQMMRYLFESTREIFPCDRLALAFFEEGGARMVAHHAVADYEPLLLRPGYSEDLVGSSLEHVMRDGVPRIINDLPAYLEHHPNSGSTRLLVEEGVKSSMTCPLVLDGEVIGVLFRSSRSVGTYDEKDARKHWAISDRLAQAVAKMRQLEVMAEGERAYHHMLDFVGVGLKGTLKSMLAEIEGLVGEEALAHGHRDRLAVVLERGLDLHELLKDYADLRRIERGELELAVQEQVDCEHQVLVPAIELVRKQLNGAELEVHLPGEARSVECDPGLLTTVVGNLLTNAVKYSVGGGLIRVSLEQDQAGFAISVRNEGAGFAPENRARLFRRFGRLTGANGHGASGTGLGLYAAWKIVTLHGGRMDAQSEHGKWAEFSLSIPQPLEPRTVPEA